MLRLSLCESAVSGLTCAQMQGRGKAHKIRTLPADARIVTMVGCGGHSYLPHSAPIHPHTFTAGILRLIDAARKSELAVLLPVNLVHVQLRTKAQCTFAASGRPGASRPWGPCQPANFVSFGATAWQCVLAPAQHHSRPQRPARNVDAMGGWTEAGPRCHSARAALQAWSGLPRPVRQCQPQEIPPSPASASSSPPPLPLHGPASAPAGAPPPAATGPSTVRGGSRQRRAAARARACSAVTASWQRTHSVRMLSRSH